MTAIVLWPVLSRLLWPPPPPPPMVNLNDLRARKVSWPIKGRVRKDGGTKMDLFTKSGRPVGDFVYRSSDGYVGGIFLEKPFRHQGLEQQLLLYAMRDMKAAGAKYIWEVVTEDTQYYGRLWNFSYVPKDICPPCTGMGYKMAIPEDIDSLKVDTTLSMYHKYSP